MNSVDISIIVPVFNTGAYIERCLNSILNQTYKNFEVVVVDDGSSDESPVIIEKLALEDDRIRIIRLSENQGVHTARWTGIQLSKGDYISFVDSDDWLALDTVEYGLSNIQQSDLVVFGMCAVNESGKRQKERVRFRKKTIYDGQLVERFSSGQLGSGSLCNKIFRHELLKEPKIWNTSARVDLNEDYLVNFHVYRKARKVILLPKIKYFALERQGSASRQKLPEDLFLQAISTCATCLEVFSDDENLLSKITEFYLRVLKFPIYSMGEKRVLNDTYQAQLRLELERIIRVRPSFFYDSLSNRLPLQDSIYSQTWIIMHLKRIIKSLS